MRIVDVHNHILPGLDHGAKTVRDSIKMATQAVKDGVDIIIATPQSSRQNGCNYEQVKLAVDIFQQELNRYEIPLVILPGQELKYDMAWFASNLEQALEKSRQYWLIDIGTKEIPTGIEGVVFQLTINKQLPVVSHPELNATFQKHPRLLEEYILRGMLAQVEAGSFLGKNGRKAKKLAWAMLEKDQIFVIASGAHDHIKKKNNLVEAYDRIQKKLGTETVQMLQKNAAYLADTIQ
ncbi:tyrosine-protein phosphatase [Listeria rustica]|uniref:Tyrosine-protein phosphatase n=1 Tax=Listeria rustica TaxID=2713503 RepID=A0A7W1T524_9LIST|nr:CpsB/CapC family capsule biosynthesis tyrosine phosphatase [Listeria rustica]MBA3925610.1 hypothetical protein [Listeria rustica]